MSNAFRFDHAIITVNDLDIASDDYRALGFNVFYGGRHASGTTHNALVTFTDGSYLELIALTGEAPQSTEVADFSSFFERGEGLIGYALYTPDLASHVQAMREEGLNVSQPQFGQRARADGEALKWYMSLVDGHVCPLLIQDITLRQWRVFHSTEMCQQPNGVRGVETVTIVVPHLDAGIARYKALLGVPPLVDHTAGHFMIGPTRLIITLPEDEDMRAHLAHFGDAPYQLTFKTADKFSRGHLELAKTHGARLILVE